MRGVHLFPHLWLYAVYNKKRFQNLFFRETPRGFYLMPVCVGGMRGDRC